MKLSIPYGDGVMPLVLGDQSIRVVSPEHFPPDEHSVMRSLTNHAESSFESFISKRDRILVVINDHTRPLAEAALKKLPLHGKEVTTIIATGTHRSPTSKELARLLGGDIPPYGGRVVIHDATDDRLTRSIGRTTRGTEVRLNSRVFDADGFVVIGSVEPHYYAGFTGGRKFLLPGLAAFKSIEMNHSLAIDDRARILVLDGNPVHEDFMDALQMFGRNEDIFSIQLVMNTEHRISFASSGHIVNSFTDAVQQALRTYASPVPSKADILIAIVSPPLDLDLYQAHKAIENVKPALNDDGILILLAQCRDGIGNRAFYDLLSKRDPSRIVKEQYTFGGHKALRIIQLLQRAKIFAVTELDPKVMKGISISPFADLQSAVDNALALKGNDANIMLVNDAGVTVPIPRQELK
ncbi:MAG: nickel-dependent lactate racemase [Candidatus Bathyarchaeia archaeon]|jgi:nickel-dependent lactate racemase